MAINLQELRTAVQTYLDTKVTVSLSNLIPATGATINPNEEFTFSVTAVNAAAAASGISLKNVRYRIWVDNPAIGKLIAPPAPMVVRSGSSSTSPLIAAGTQVSDMYLFPPTDTAGNYLSPGDTDTISNLRGKAGGGAAGGSTHIHFKIIAEPDMDYLFPKNEDSPTALKTLSVLG